MVVREKCQDKVNVKRECYKSWTLCKNLKVLKNTRQLKKEAKKAIRLHQWSTLTLFIYTGLRCD
ncbi:hypothetical protein Lal_00018799 [Lupinus albus]|nr:hypothetical protein Lal_00018799 [Lupinus albus]